MRRYHRLRNEADGAGRFDPALGGEDKTIEARLVSNPIEFDGIEIGVIQLFPDTTSVRLENGKYLPLGIGDVTVPC